MMGPQPVGEGRSTQRAVSAAEATGLDVVDLQHATLRTVFNDIGAVVHLLRKVIWIVPGFTVDRHHPQLAQLHDWIEADGPLATHAQRFLIEARKPG